MSEPMPIAAMSAPQEMSFPLSDLQQAYWIGENYAPTLRTPAYIHKEFTTAELDIDRLGAALRLVYEKHPMLRARVDGNGIQHIDPLSRDVGCEILNGTIADHLPSLASGRQAVCVVTKRELFHVHLLLRLSSFDARSLDIFFNDLVASYTGVQSRLLPESLPFSTYIERSERARGSAAYQKSIKYWTQRTASQVHPQLPRRDPERVPEVAQFSRRQWRVSADLFESLQSAARTLHVSLNSLLCTAYADVLRLWSGEEAFCINVIVSSRSLGSDQFANTLGNFGKTLLLAIPARRPDKFSQRVFALQSQLYTDLQHAQVSAIEVARALRENRYDQPIGPVVFASGLGVSHRNELLTPEHLGWTLRDSHMSTPQVWLDHQAYVEEGELILNWDCVEELFPAGLIDAMFETYRSHLLAIARDPAGVESVVVSDSHLRARRLANQTDAQLSSELLHEAFLRNRHACGDASALIASDRTISYDVLWRYSSRLAAQLRALNVTPNSLVAVVARRSWRQIAAVLAVLQAGGAYLPIAADVPVARKRLLSSQAAVKVILVDDDLSAEVSEASHQTTLVLDRVLPDATPESGVELESVQHCDDLAYVIYTSGSTGVPKGVAIGHRGAVNTVRDVLNRFDVTGQDVGIAISALNFDLSVFDIFGLLSVGGALVLPPASNTPSPEDWLRCMASHRVTLWNTVPALMEMLLEYVPAHQVATLASWRLVMLSGDWIQTSLPGRIKAVAPNAAVIALGGATEASIWSNYFPVGHVDPTWKSIPYGWPLANQRYHVLSEALEPVPTWVAGQLYIGGVGLAEGYFGDAERTAQSFIHHPRSSERLYRTGDYGRYLPDGSIEFLGRRDTQLKIRGFRVELGEIDAAMLRTAQVRDAVTVARRVGQGNDLQLVAFVTPADEARALDPHAIKEYLSTQLPGYMVPSVITALDSLPLTHNGKVDRKALTAYEIGVPMNERKSYRQSRDALEATLCELWSELLEVAAVGIDDDFFELGGSSLIAVRLLNAIRARIGVTLPLASLFHNATVARQAVAIRSAQTESMPEAVSPLVTIRASARHMLCVVHPVGGNVLCYRELSQLLDGAIGVIALQSLGQSRDRTVHGLARHYLQALASAGTGDIHLLGWSMGGVIAHEMALQLESRGQHARSLTMIDSWMRDASVPLTALDEAAITRLHTRDVGTAGAQQADTIQQDQQRAEYLANYHALLRHQPGVAAVATHMYRATREQPHDFAGLIPFRLPSGSMTEVSLDEDHFSIMQGAALCRIADELAQRVTGSMR